MSEFIMVITTTQDRQEAEHIAHTLVQEKIAACVHIEEVQSIYQRQDSIQDTIEYRISAKTRRELYKDIEERIMSLHSYEIPEIIAIPITALYEEYAERLHDNTNY